MANLSASGDYNTWANTLSTMVTKHGLSTGNISGWVGQTVSAGTPGTYAQINNLRGDVERFMTASPFFNNSGCTSNCSFSSTISWGNYNTGQPQLLATKTAIEAKLADLNAICANYNPYNASYQNQRRINYGGNTCTVGQCYRLL